MTHPLARHREEWQQTTAARDVRAGGSEGPEWPFGSGRLFGLFCLGFGLLVLAGNAAGLLLARQYVPGLCLLAPPIALLGAVLAALPERLTKWGQRSALTGILVAAALAVGFALGVVL